MRTFTNTSTNPFEEHRRFSDVSSISRHNQTIPASLHLQQKVDTPTVPQDPFEQDVSAEVTCNDDSVTKESLEGSNTLKPSSTNPFEMTLASTAAMTLPPPSPQLPSPACDRSKRRRLALWLGVGVLTVSFLVLGVVLFYAFYVTPEAGAEQVLAQRDREGGTRLRGSGAVNASGKIVESAESSVSSASAAETTTPIPDRYLPPPSEVLIHAEQDRAGQETLATASLTVTDDISGQSPAASSSQDTPIMGGENEKDIKWLLGGIDVVALHNATSEHAVLGDQRKHVVVMEEEGLRVAFASKENADLFWLQPEKYLPSFGGYNVWRLCSEYTFERPDDDVFDIYDDRLVLFSNEDEKFFFSQHPAECWEVAEYVYAEALHASISQPTPANSE